MWFPVCSLVISFDINVAGSRNQSIFVLFYLSFNLLNCFIYAILNANEYTSSFFSVHIIPGWNVLYFIILLFLWCMHLCPSLVYLKKSRKYLIKGRYPYTYFFEKISAADFGFKKFSCSSNLLLSFFFFHLCLFDDIFSCLSFFYKYSYTFLIGQFYCSNYCFYYYGFSHYLLLVVFPGIWVKASILSSPRLLSILNDHNHVLVWMVKVLYLIFNTASFIFPLSWAYIIHRLHLCRGLRSHHQRVSRYDSKHSNVGAPLMLELLGMQCSHLLPSLSGAL